ncbi:hypothetical protein FB451DRAFT_1152562 [Mycena latifolia]|nr:hypothetical protein FB451DRAFT_1152562 [Mycena latifolia]
MGWGPDPEELIFHLRQLGVEFRVCIRDSPCQAPLLPRPPRFSGLGFRPKSYRPTPLDFRAYETHRDRFLKSPRGRAALFAGGIVGRLARQIVNPDLASLGPSAEVFQSGVCLWDGASSTASYWDDSLTEYEVDLICGIYEVGTGRVSKFRDDTQTTRLSWWPTPSSFKASGLNIGWWSPACEEWLQKRLDDIKNGKADLKTQKEWTSNIRFFAACRKVGHANEDLAAEYLSHLLP